MRLNAEMQRGGMQRAQDSSLFPVRENTEPVLIRVDREQATARFIEDIIEAIARRHVRSKTSRFPDAPYDRR